MATKTLPVEDFEGILGNPDFKAVFEEVASLDEKVGTQAYELRDLKFKRGATVSVLDETVDVTASVELAASMKIHKGGTKLKDLFGTGEEHAAPDGTSFADFSLVLGGSVGAKGSAPAGPLTVSAKGSLASSIDYRHVLPVSQKHKRLTALTRLARTTRPPQLIRLTKQDLEVGEVHRLDASLNLDLALKAEFGHDFALERAVELFQGLPSADVQVSGELAVRAALGLSLYERMYLAIGRDDRWARVRLQRERERRIGFSAMMALHAEYDFGGGLAAVLEQALDQSPVPRLLDSARAIVDPAAGGDWDAIKARLTGKLADAVSELVDDTGWKEWLADSSEVAKLLETSREIVDFYDGIDERVASFWDQLLGKADLGPGSEIRKRLSELAKLDEAGALEKFLSLPPEIERLVDLIETLSGSSLEEILLSSNAQIKSVLAEVAGLARRAEKLFDLDDEVVRRIRKFAEDTGIARTIDILRQAQTKEDLEELLSARLRKLIERLAGKAWEQIQPKDLEKIQKWAEKTQSLLQGAEDVQEKILQKIRDVRGEVGFSIGLEIERVSTTTALLDFDVDLGSDKVFRGKVEQALSGGRVRAVLNALAKEADENDGALPFRLRECVFTSRRVRTSAVSFLFSFLGLGNFVEKQTGISRRIEESTLRVTQVGNQLRRAASYSGGFQRTETWNKATSESAMWLEIEAGDTGKMSSLESPFGEERSRALRATYTREDLETRAVERAALAARLEGLGFVGGTGLDAVPAPAHTLFTFDVRLPGKALSDFCGSAKKGSRWDDLYLDAARLWFADRLVEKTFGPGDVSLGAVLDAFTRTDVFADTWTKSVSDFVAAASTGNQPKRFKLAIGGDVVIVEPLEVVKPSPAFGSFDPLRVLIRKRGGSLKGLGKLGKALEATEGRSPGAYEEAIRTFANAWRATTAFSVAWPAPTFGLWLLLSFLSKLDGGAGLRDATGVALLRWKQGGEWQGPVVWRLPEGKGVKPLAGA